MGLILPFSFSLSLPASSIPPPRLRQPMFVYIPCIVNVLVWLCFTALVLSRALVVCWIRSTDTVVSVKICARVRLYIGTLVYEYLSLAPCGCQCIFVCEFQIEFYVFSHFHPSAVDLSVLSDGVVFASIRKWTLFCAGLVFSRTCLALFLLRLFFVVQIPFRRLIYTCKAIDV